MKQRTRHMPIFGGTPAATVVSATLALLSGCPATCAAANTHDTHVPPDFWLESVLEPASPYVQAQAVFALRLYQAVSLRDLEFHAPTAPLADIRPIDGERVSEINRGERRYRLTERRYAVFPFASGKLELPEAHVSARTATGAATTASPLRIVAPTGVHEVLPMPPGSRGAAWVPARALVLAETWSADPAEARVGEPLRRTIRIEAHGVDAAQLPEVVPAGPGFSAHAEPPRLDNHFDDMWNVGIREQVWQVVPARPGSLVLPAIDLPWWDVVTHRMRRASLPARTIHVTTGSGHEPAPEPSPADTHAGPPQGMTTSPPTSEPSSAPAPAEPAAKTTDTIPVFATVAAALAVVAGLLFHLHLRRHHSAWRELKKACRRHDPRAARDAVLRWVARYHPAAPPHTLGEVARWLPKADAQAALADLDRHLYGPDTPAWDGRILLASLATWRYKSRPSTAVAAHATPRRFSGLR